MIFPKKDKIQNAKDKYFDLAKILIISDHSFSSFLILLRLY